MPKHKIALCREKRLTSLGLSLTEGYRGEVNLAMEDWTGHLSRAPRLRMPGSPIPARVILPPAFIATKVLPRNLRFADLMGAAEGSLKLLQTDNIDLYQLLCRNPAIPISLLWSNYLPKQPQYRMFPTMSQFFISDETNFGYTGCRLLGMVQEK